MNGEKWKYLEILTWFLCVIDKSGGGIQGQMGGIVFLEVQWNCLYTVLMRCESA